MAKQSPPQAAKIIEDAATHTKKVIVWGIQQEEGKPIKYSFRLFKTPKTSKNGKLFKQEEASISLDEEVFFSLLDFFDNECKFLKRGTRFPDLKSPAAVDFIKKLLETEQKEVLNLIENNQINPSDLLVGWQLREKEKAVLEYENMLETKKNEIGEKALEPDWQKWFDNNPWVFKTDKIKIINRKAINTDSRVDTPTENYDGFLDVFELKRPDFDFWEDKKDHNNWVWHSKLTAAITQLNNYLYEIDLEGDSKRFEKKFGKAMKPNGFLIYGRSNNWDDDKMKAYRLLNSSFHNITILTFDHVLERAKRILEILKPKI